MKNAEMNSRVICPAGGTRYGTVQIISLMIILLLLALPVAGSGESDKNYILLGTVQDASSETWTLSFTPSSAINTLPGNVSHEFILSIRHKTSSNPVKSKSIDFTTDFGVFQNGAQSYTATTDENGNISLIISSTATGTATITASTQPPVQITTATMVWTGVSPYPVITLLVGGPPFLMDGEPTILALSLVNQGNVPLTEPQITVNGANATYSTGDDGNGVLDSTESWRYTYTAPVLWNQDFPARYIVNASARFGTLVLQDTGQVTYRSLLITKNISNPLVRDAYRSTPFNVTARQEGDGVVFGPFPISIQDPAKILVRPGNWTMTEENRTISGETLEPLIATIWYREGESSSQGFENRLTQYLPIVTHVTLSEREAANNLSAGESSHTFQALVSDQYGEPLAGIPLTFNGMSSVSGRQVSVVPSNETGWAEWTVSSEVPQTMEIRAFLDANQDTYFNTTEGEIGDTGMKTWYYLPVPANLEIQGVAKVTNNLDRGEFNHTFQIRLLDQYGYPVQAVPLSYEVDYRLQDERDVDSLANTDSGGIINITVASSVPDVANITVYRETEQVNLQKTWVYTPAPQSIMIQGYRDAVNDLDEGEFGHTFVLTVLDQFQHPLPVVQVHFTVNYQNLSRETESSDITTDEYGNASFSVESHTPDLATITASVGDISEILTKNWTYTQIPSYLEVEGASDALNNLSQEEFEHTFNVTIQDQFGVGIPHQEVFCSVGYKIQTGLNRSETLFTDLTGNLSIGVTSRQPDRATMVCTTGDRRILLNKTWYIEKPPLTTLSLQKTAEDQNGGILVVGDVIRYTLTLENTGEYPALGIVVADPLSEFVTCMDVSGDRAGPCEVPLMWQVGTLQRGEILHLSINTTLNGGAVGQSVLNTANATGANVEETLSDPLTICPDGALPTEGRCPHTPVQPTELVFTKSAVDENGAPLQEGDRIRYTLRVQNIGAYTAYNVTITDILPSGITCLDVDGDPGGCDSPITRTWEILENGTEESLLIHTRIDTGTAGMSLINTGTVTSSNTQPVDPPRVCPDGSKPVDDLCPSPIPPIPPVTPEPPNPGNLFHLARRAVEDAYTETIIETSECGDGEIYVEGRGCIRCGPDEVFMEGKGCVKQNLTSLVLTELPRDPLTMILAMFTNLLMNPLLILALVLLLVLVLVFWLRREKSKEGLESDWRTARKSVVLSWSYESAYASIITILNDIDDQVASLEHTIARSAVLSPMEANAVVGKFFYTAQVAEEQMKNPDIQPYLTAEQIGFLNTQLQAAVQRMIALSHRSEHLLNAVQEHFGTTAMNS
jgi:uncharacterized repeat protein (TIGR01451 family)